jgi:hypothetical protein
MERGRIEREVDAHTAQAGGIAELLGMGSDADVARGAGRAPRAPPRRRRGAATVAPRRGRAPPSPPARRAPTAPARAAPVFPPTASPRPFPR